MFCFHFSELFEKLCNKMVVFLQIIFEKMCFLELEYEEVNYSFVNEGTLFSIFEDFNNNEQLLKKLFAELSNLRVN